MIDPVVGTIRVIRTVQFASCAGYALARRAILASMLLVAAQGAQAHPHVWIKYGADVQMHGGAIVAIAETWRFTEGFPVQLVGIASAPKEGPMNATQTAMFKAQAFDALARFSYYNHLFIDGKAQHLDGPSDFRVATEHGDVVYRFTLRLITPVVVTGHDVALGIWDPSFFVDYEPDAATPSDAIRLNAAATGGSSGCTTKTFSDEKHPIFNDMIIPKAVAIACTP